MIRAVVFDMDGVLIDSEIVYLRHQAETLKKNYPWIKEEDLYPLVGMDNKEDKFFLAGLLGREPSDPAFLRELSSMYDALEVDYPSILRREAKDLLEKLKEAGMKIGLASSSPLSNITEVIQSCGIHPYFDCIASGEQFPRSKPDPEIYFSVIRSLDVLPKECLIVEDSTYGVTAAHRAGACVIALRDDRFQFDQSLADHQISSLDEVMCYIL